MTGMAHLRIRLNNRFFAFIVMQNRHTVHPVHRRFLLLQNRHTVHPVHNTGLRPAAF